MYYFILVCDQNIVYEKKSVDLKYILPENKMGKMRRTRVFTIKERHVNLRKLDN